MKTKKFAFTAIAAGLTGIGMIVLTLLTFDGLLEEAMAEYNPLGAFNHLTYFTVITNLLADIWLINVGFSILFKREKYYAFLTKPYIHGAISVYISIVGIVYCGILFWYIGPYPLHLWWGNIIDVWNHFFMPIFFTLLFLRSPASVKLGQKHIFLWMSYPAAYMIFSLIRGHFAGWYPYFFIDPTFNFDGWHPYITLSFNFIILVALFYGVSFLLTHLYNRKLKTRPEPQNK